MWLKVWTKPSAWIFKSAFSQPLVWLSLIATLIISIGSIWTFYSMNAMIQASQEQREIALGKGLANSISDLIVTREYAQIENDLQQVMGNVDIRSVLVVDLQGNVLAYLERKTQLDEVRSNFSLRKVDLPQSLAGEFAVSKEGGASVLWYQVNPGIPLAWIRMESFDKLTDALLSNLRINIMASVLVLCFSLFGVAVVLLYRAKQLSEDKERQLVSKNKTLHTAAHVDTLTKLPNRLALGALLNSAIVQSKCNADLLAVCFLDLDNFKRINDQMGHLTGDSLLVAAAGRMLQAVRNNDAVIRLGGDEFILLLGNIQNEDELDVLLRRVLDLLGAPFMVEGESMMITASIGASIFPKDALMAGDLVDHADRAMYEAKKKGKNAWALYRV
jgi:diguanylate cyclase (GGDEF)-like protein